MAGYSAHADAGQVVEWLSGLPDPHTAYLVHGQPEAARALGDRLREELGWSAVVPRYLERVRLRARATRT